MRHAFPSGERCVACERDYQEEAMSRRAVKLIFALPVGLFSGGLLLALMMHFSIGALAIAVMAAIACAVAAGSAVAMCALVDRTARAMFLREKSPGLPEARLLPPGVHHL
ncbi:MAG: hypothetical protein QM831_40575 [Kofleriaceae bacterium]